MSILLEINITAQSIWQNNSVHEWADDDAHKWIDGQLLQISDENFMGDTFWNNFLMSFSSPQYRLRNSYGGYCEMQFGSFEVSQDVFHEANIWPPSRSFSVTIYYTPDTEANKELLFEGTAYRVNFDRSQVGYELYGPEYEANLLSETTGYASAEQNLSNAAATDEGGGLVGIPCPSHGYKEGDTVVISGSTNYEGSHTLPSQIVGSGDIFVITVTYNAETFAGTETVAHSAAITIPHAFGIINHGKVIRLPDVGGKPIYHNAYIAGTKGTEWHVYDDGVNIDSNVTDNNDNTFSLSAVPTGEVTICGTGSQTTLATIFIWACSAARLPMSLDLTKATVMIGLSWLEQASKGKFSVAVSDLDWLEQASKGKFSAVESPSPPINFWADSQTKLIDFLSLIAAWHTHFFYIKTSTLYLIGMDTDNGDRTITEYDYFPAQYLDQAPLAKLIGTWKERSAANETIGRFIREAQYEEIHLTSYSYGGKMSLEAFQNVRADVKSSLQSISTIYHKQHAKIPLPIETKLPVPGEAINGIDTSTKRDITFAIRARDIQYDFMGGVPKAIISGEGIITS